MRECGHLTLHVGGEAGGDDLMRDRVGRAVRQRRRECGLTLEQLAERAGVSRSHLSDVERGSREASSEVLRAIHQGLGLTVDQLLDRARRDDSGDAGVRALAA